MFSWDAFVKTLAQTPIEFERLKAIQLAQAILESGRGTSDLYKLHANPYGMKYRPEMAQIATPVEYTASDGTDIYCKFANLENTVKGYWVFIERAPYQGWRQNNSTPEAYIRFIAYAGYIGGPFDGSEKDKAIKEEYIAKVLRLVPEARQLLEKYRIWRAKGVMLEVGHGQGDPGVPGVNGISEYDLNFIAARAAKATIDAAGVPCVITDTKGILYNIGKLAAGHDVFCSIHHNSATSSAQGAEVLVHRTKTDPADLRLSAIMSAEIAKELSIRDRIAGGRDPRQSLEILSGAEDTNVRVSVLALLYFISVRVPNARDWSRRGGQAVGRAILKWLRETAG